ncbi:hypothetical protein ACU4GR_09710 (plasmid) [Methylobacterium oryzae CBMB20]
MPLRTSRVISPASQSGIAPLATSRWLTDNVVMSSPGAGREPRKAPFGTSIVSSTGCSLAIAAASSTSNSFTGPEPLRSAVNSGSHSALPTGATTKTEPICRLRAASVS